MINWIIWLAVILIAIGYGVFLGVQGTRQKKNS